MDKQDQTVYYNASQLIDNYKQDNKVKQITNQVPFFKEIDLTDISLFAGGNDEDILYVYNKNYRDNLRRGNTVATIYDKKGNVISDYKVRKGLPKFFDLYREYMQFNLGEQKELNSFGVKNQSEHTTIQKIIFQDVQNAMEQGREIEILKMNKANGENCQISYFAEKKSWIIASKNVSLLAQYRDDIYNYKKDRYAYAKLIAEQWFNILQDLGKKKVNQLKEYLENMTLVGEYCGNRKYQHLVKYEHIDLHFFGLVDNECTDVTCIPPLEFFKFLKQYNLTAVKYQSLGVYSDWQELNKNLLKAFDTTASASIEEEEEGSVIYLIKKAKNDQEFDDVLSISKLKTLEYRLYRKLREKLRSYISKKYADKKALLLKFQEECQDLCKQNNPSRPLEYYFKVAQTAFQFAQQYNQFSDLIHDEYITFLSIVIYCVEKNTNVTPNLFFKQGLSDAILSKPWSKYSTDVALNNFSKIEQKKFVSKGGNKKVTVLIPISIPGMGKTTFRNMLDSIIKQKTGQNLIIVSSDEIRRNLMDQRKLKYPKESQDQLFDNTLKSNFKEWNNQMENAFQQKTQQIQSDHVYIFIDKNHPPNGIEKTVKSVKNICPVNYELEIIGLIPQTEDDDKFSSSKDYQFPFSLQLMLECVSRVQFRKDHPTLPGSGSKSANVMILFLNMFRNVTLSDQICLSAGMDKVLRFPFHKPQKLDIKQEIIDQLSHILNITIPNQKCENIQLVEQFSQLLAKNPINFATVDLKEIENLVEKCFDQNFASQKFEQQQQNDNDNIQEVEQDKNEIPSTQGILYQGIFAQDSDKAKSDIQTHVIQSLEYLKHNVNDYDVSLIDTDIQNITQQHQFIYPNSIHVTSLFIGGQKYEKLNEKQQKIFNSFKENIETDIIIKAIAYVPGKIICGIAQLSDQSILIANQYPHVTMFVNNYPPKMSNTVLEAVLDNEKLEQLNQNTNIVQEHRNTKLNSQEQDIFIIKIQKSQLIIQGITQNFVQTPKPNKKSILKKKEEEEKQIQENTQNNSKKIKILTPDQQESQELKKKDKKKTKKQQQQKNNKNQQVAEKLQTENPEVLENEVQKQQQQNVKQIKQTNIPVQIPIDYKKMSQEEIDILRYKQRGFKTTPKYRVKQ